MSACSKTELLCGAISSQRQSSGGFWKIPDLHIVSGLPLLPCERLICTGNIWFKCMLHVRKVRSSPWICAHVVSSGRVCRQLLDMLLYHEEDTWTITQRHIYGNYIGFPLSSWLTQGTSIPFIVPPSKQLDFGSVENTSARHFCLLMKTGMTVVYN